MKYVGKNVEIIGIYVIIIRNTNRIANHGSAAFTTLIIGIPATPERDQWKMWVHVRQLPKIQKQLKQMQQLVNRLQESDAAQPRHDAA